MDKKLNPDTTTPPLCVDLDGTLIRSDLLVESMFALIKKNFLYMFLLPLWLLRGKAGFKQQIADRVTLDVTHLPYHDTFLDYLRQQHASGHRLVLATASNVKFAEAVAAHLGIFNDILASTADTNLSGKHKLQRLKELFGTNGFDYAGNAKKDLAILSSARTGILVNPEWGVRRSAEGNARKLKLFDDRAGRLSAQYIRAMRLHQWLKNLLVFIPLLMAHRITEPMLAGQAVLAFLSFGLCASSVYILNDLLDLPEDRKHRTKRHRPLAAGRIPIIHGVILVPVLLVMAFAIAFLLPVEFMAVLAFYYLVTMAYSLRFKTAALVDVLLLAGLYTLRIIAGAAAVSVVPSFWLLAFSMFLFLSLALVKRYAELSASKIAGNSLAGGRGYRITDLELLSQFGSASAYTAVLVLALYINSDTVRGLYTHPEIIWLLCPLLLYVISRIWLLARREELDEDPVVFAIRDRRTQWLAGIGVILLWLAT
jgi:4-hydroxybenzoate polyprenyltransferase